MDAGVKRLISEITKEPWVAVFWPSCQKEKVVRELGRLIDDMIFDHEPLAALEMAEIFRGLSKRIKETHLQCKAEACLGSVFRLLGLYNFAEEQLRYAERLAASCDNCLCEVYKRWAVLFGYKNALDASLDFSDRALVHAEIANVAEETCDCLLSRGATCRLMGRNIEGFENVRRAVGLLSAEMPSRFFVAAAVNALSLAVASGEPSKVSLALTVVEDVRSKTHGSRAHSRALPILRWIRGLAFDKIGNSKEAIRSIEAALPALDRLQMIEEKKAAMADLARIRRKGKQLETNDRHIRRLIEECLRLERDIKRVKILERAKRDPSEENILAWRSSVGSYVPIMEPGVESKAIV